MINHCEHHERNVSTLLDDTLSRDEQIELLDHLVRCEPCREFYSEARALDGLIATVRIPREASPPPPEMWERIERSARRSDPQMPTVESSWWSGWRAAAAILVAVGLGVLLMNGVEEVVPSAYPGEIQLAEHAGQMSEARFMELATELLRADPRYHWAMYEVMQQVIRDTGAREDSQEYYRPDEVGEDVAPEQSFTRSPA